MNFIVKTHKKDTIYNKPHFFVLNKGMNSGKPQNEPFTNSFVVIFDSEADSENIFWIAYSLWKSKFWYVAALKLLELKEKQFNENINLINDMRRVIVHRYSNR